MLNRGRRRREYVIEIAKRTTKLQRDENGIEIVHAILLMHSSTGPMSGMIAGVGARRTGRGREVSRSDHADGPWITRNHLVRSQKLDSLDRCLCDKDSIKGIPVDRRQGVDGQGMLARDGELLVAVVQEPSSEEPAVDLKIRATEPGLDRDFPHASSAEQEPIPWVAEERMGLAGQSIRFPGRP